MAGDLAHIFSQWLNEACHYLIEIVEQFALVGLTVYALSSPNIQRRAQLRQRAECCMAYYGVRVYSWPMLPLLSMASGPPQYQCAAAGRNP